MADGEDGALHVGPDEDGHVLVHGLLRAVLPTQIGGERDSLATRIDEFRGIVRGER